MGCKTHTLWRDGLLLLNLGVSTARNVTLSFSGSRADLMASRIVKVVNCRVVHCSIAAMVTMNG
ncbi:hypothetical protein P3339_19020 [Microbulbifer sp. MLAF003]|uniref:hypothetical protein n=1 Tax=unclassified Microbulbifer TaxID=2619833 RepID=UPI0024AD36D0|nr:hypothetical protein [Microbulbifer sp. MLAF003]WHI50509.1 hypothetical protein P3339_19020 [Microbulbifer sp. MLAF003]